MTIVLLDQLEVMLVDKRRAKGRHDNTDRNWNEHKTSLASRVSLALLVNDGICDEEHVQKTVEDTHVQRNEEHDEFAKEELERSNKENSKTFRDGTQIKFLLSNVVGLASLGSELASATGEDSRGVGLGDGEGDENPNDEGKDKLDPVEPAPASSIGEETTNKRTD